IEADGVGVMAAFGCNFEGDVPQERVLALLKESGNILARYGKTLRRITLADTMGWANPVSIRSMVREVQRNWPDARIKLHLHDTRGLGIANAIAAMELGVQDFDAAVGGLGGCPFAGNK